MVIIAHVAVIKDSETGSDSGTATVIRWGKRRRGGGNVGKRLERGVFGRGRRRRRRNRWWWWCL